MVKGRKNVGDYKSERITVQVTGEEKRLLEYLSKRKGVTISCYIRMFILEEYNKEVNSGYAKR